MFNVDAPASLTLQDVEGIREEAEGLVSKSLLLNVGGGGYRVHDLLLEFMKIKIKGEDDIIEIATERQTQYLGRLDVVKSYGGPEHGAGNQGLLVLDALWRSVQKLSGDLGLEVSSYDASLRELESCEATTDVASCFAIVGLLCYLQVCLVFPGCLAVVISCYICGLGTSPRV